MDTAVALQLKPRARHPLSNGTRRFLFGDGRTRSARRQRDLEDSLSRPFGGFRNLDEGSKQLIRRIAFLSTQAETLEARAISGEPIDLLRHLELTKTIRMCLAKLELRHPTTTAVSPGQALDDHLAKLARGAKGTTPETPSTDLETLASSQGEGPSGGQGGA